MIKIDGGHGEGGGQIIRTSLGLSALTGKSFEIINIRKNRSNPGLQEQHLQGVKAVKKLCNANVKGAELHSTKLVFEPNEITKNKLKIKINTAGSIALVLQSLLIASLNNDLRIRIEGGGTWNKWAPSVLYLKEVFCGLIEKFGYNIKIDILNEGFYPKGGALVDVIIKKNNLKRINLVDTGKLKLIKCFSVATRDLSKGKVAERQATSAKNILGRNIDFRIDSSVNYVDSLSTGSGLLIKADYENTVLGSDAVGEKGVQSEKLGEGCAVNMVRHLLAKVSVDNFMLDQILPFLAIAKGEVKFLDISEHARTNIEIIKKFLDVDFKIENKIIKV
ncbi:RNA 3'-terminal phosphate cyclase [Candidatus Woesearchaeota archaeon]|nr:RNA 3'-terminal phosphate cyclase [Candidatus Woesearchaeota archaeon]